MKVELLIFDTASKTAFEQHRSWLGCERCLIGCQANHHVLARGVVPCDILFIGEGPGNNEDALGWPFVGQSGKLLNNWIKKASVAVARIDPVHTAFAKCVQKIDELPLMFTHAITNLVCCRPTEIRGGKLRNRPPSTEEIRNCRPRLLEFVNKVAQPRGIVLVGKHAEYNLPPEISHIPHISIGHPSWILQSGERGGRKEQLQIDKLSAFVVKEMTNVKAAG